MAVQADNAAQSTGLTALISTMQRNTDVVLAAGVMMIIAMMVIPLPAPLIDLLVATNIAVAVTVLLIAMYTRDVLAFSVFPALLLLVTLFRLAINVSSTRLILLQADAGDIIASFGNFVVGGSVVVGIVVFLILLVIQFVVITNGGGRVAEVATRFTLDAMPGKQMSIDADLNAGIINEADARERRDRITKEADFYGAMDGASKFVKGDAIAGRGPRRSDRGASVRCRAGAARPAFRGPARRSPRARHTRRGRSQRADSRTAARDRRGRPSPPPRRAASRRRPREARIDDARPRAHDARYCSDVTVKGALVKLRQREFDLLHAFLRHPQRRAGPRAPALDGLGAGLLR